MSERSVSGAIQEEEVGGLSAWVLDRGTAIPLSINTRKEGWEWAIVI